MKNNKGFTLVEILAVVVVLGIVILIATNVVLKQLDKSRKQAFLTDVQQFIKSTSYDTLVKNKIDEFVVYEFPNSGIEILSKNADAGYMLKNEDENIKLQIWNRNMGLCAVKSFTDKEVSYDESIKSEKDCNALLPNVVSDKNLSVKAITGENTSSKINSTCYSLDSNNNLTNFDTANCGTVLVIPNKVNGNKVNGISSEFITNAPKNFTAVYIIGVENITNIPRGFLQENPNLKKVVISMLPNLETINTDFAKNSYALNTLHLSHLPKLENMTTKDGLAEFGIFNFEGSNLENLTLEDLPKLSKIHNSFIHTKINKVYLSNLDSLEEITSSSFTDNDADTELVISNNKNLTKIYNSAFNATNYKSVKIFNNEKLVSITNGSFTGLSGNKNYLDDLQIYDNPNLENVDNTAFANFEIKNVQFKNNPKLVNIRNGAFGAALIENVDLSDVNMTVFNFSGFYNASIDNLTIPSTITSFTNGTVGTFNTLVKEKIRFGGSDKCSLINLFRTSNGDGTYTYLVDKDKLPDCP